MRGNDGVNWIPAHAFARAGNRGTRQPELQKRLNTCWTLDLDPYGLHNTEIFRRE